MVRVVHGAHLNSVLAETKHVRWCQHKAMALPEPSEINVPALPTRRVHDHTNKVVAQEILCLPSAAFAIRRNREHGDGLKFNRVHLHRVNRNIIRTVVCGTDLDTNP